MTNMEHEETGWANLVLYRDLRACGCGFFDERLDMLRETLKALPLYEAENRPAYLDTPLGEWFLCLIDGAGLIDHGSTIGGSWITKKGERFLAVIDSDEDYAKFVESDGALCDCEACRNA